MSGTFEGDTDAAVRKVQAAFGYTVDGIVGPGTHTLINAKLGIGEKVA